MFGRWWAMLTSWASMWAPTPRRAACSPCTLPHAGCVAVHAGAWWWGGREGGGSVPPGAVGVRRGLLGSLVTPRRALPSRLTGAPGCTRADTPPALPALQSKDVKFACQSRSMLLQALYQTLASARGPVPSGLLTCVGLGDWPARCSDLGVGVRGSGLGEGWVGGRRGF